GEGADALARTLLEAGTLGGGRSLGLDGGRLAPGRPAGPCAVDLRHPAPPRAPEGGLLASVGFSAPAAAGTAHRGPGPPGGRGGSRMAATGSRRRWAATSERCAGGRSRERGGGTARGDAAGAGELRHDEPAAEPAAHRLARAAAHRAGLPLRAAALPRRRRRG